MVMTKAYIVLLLFCGTLVNCASINDAESTNEKALKWLKSYHVQLHDAKYDSGSYGNGNYDNGNYGNDDYGNANYGNDDYGYDYYGQGNNRYDQNYNLDWKGNRMSRYRVDKGDCEEVYGPYDEEIECRKGYVAVGACASDHGYSCNGQYAHMLKCCRSAHHVPANVKCEVRSADDGELYKCSDGYQIISMCVSNKIDGCGSYNSARSKCCTGMGISTNHGSSCKMVRLYWGEKYECGPDEVMMGFGYCKDGRQCREKGSQVYCCQYN